MNRKVLIVLLPVVALLLLATGVRLFRGSSADRGVAVARPKPEVVTHKLEGNHWIVSRSEKEAYMKDLAGITKQITLKPNPGKVPDSVADLTILMVSEESPMYVAGFRKDDRILKVNGTPIGTMSRAVNLFHEIRTCTCLTVQVQRGDKIIDYQFDFE